MTDKTTHFGYEKIQWDEKTQKVDDVFHAVADQYDVMNDLMSLGVHRLWKRFAVAMSGVHQNDYVLDIAAGTGDLAKQYAGKVGPKGQVMLADINSSMLAVGRERLLDGGIYGNVNFVQANAECLPFKTNYFHRLSIGFGLRNVTDKEAALRSMFRVLKPGGKLMILEFSKPIFAPLQKIYDLYSFSVLPWLGKCIADSRDSYRYLAESIRMHPDQDTLQRMMETAGFEDCEYYNLSGGIVAVHTGYKY